MLQLTRPRALGILAVASCFLVYSLVPFNGLFNGVLGDSSALNTHLPAIHAPRQVTSISTPQNTSPTPAASTEASSSSQQQQTSTSNTPTSSSSPQPSPSSTPTTPATTEQSSASTPTSNTSPKNTPTSAAASQSSQTPVTSAFLTTDQGGQTVTSVVIISDSATSSSATPTPTTGSSSSDSGVSSSTIIGLSVAGGVALLGIIGFFVWKFTRKRGNEFNDNEEIKWPELNAHDANVPLPTHRTGGSGIDTTGDGRRNSAGYAPSTAANSTAELYPDPYAVPPLPHLDPNQPYLDDPTGRFYDPYRGPVPQTFDQGGAPGEAIPMTQLAGRRSPGPGQAYAGDFVGGRASPAPQGAYGTNDFVGGRASPVPPAYGTSDFGGGRASPAPQGAYGTGRVSPGPGVAYATGGRASPAPQAAYGNYGPR